MEPQGQIRRNAIPCKEHPASDSLVDRGIASATELEIYHLWGAPVVFTSWYSTDAAQWTQRGKQLKLGRGEGLE